VPPTEPVASAGAGDRAASSLRRRRDELAEQVAEQQWDLGGLAYEMAIRDHFRLDVLVRRAAQLQERDAELAEVERLLRLQDAASIGACPSCGAPHSRGALFCWQCGTTLMERAPSTAAPAAQQDAVARQDTVARADMGARQDTSARQDAAAGQDTPAQQDTLILDPLAVPRA
jgi:chorismate mutase